MTLNTQFLTMIFMVLSGLYLGIAIDTFRRFSPLWRNNLFLVYFLEICFWLSQTFILFYILYRVNAGELRLYVFLAGLLGFSIYQALAASMYKKTLEYMITWTISIYRFLSKVIYHLIYVPIKSLITVIIIVITFILQIFWKVVFFLIKAVIFPVRWVFRTTYLLLPHNIQKKVNKLAGFYSIIKNTYTTVLSYFKRR